MIAASYFDGRSAALHRARVAVRNGELLISAPGLARIYPVGGAGPAGTLVAEPFEAAPLMLRFADGAVCEIAAGPDREAMLAALAYRASRVERWQARWPAALVALVLLLALLAFAWLRGVPAAADYIAARLPASVDIKLGQAALAGLEKQKLIGPSRFSDERLDELEALLPRALPAQPRMPARLLVRDAPRLGPNALALPDGTIILTDQMVRLVLDRRNQLTEDGKNELLSVLGHEVGHLERRHAAHALASSSLMAALSAALFGDFSAVAAGLPAVLSQMQYSRGMEGEADDEAVRVLRRNHIPLQAFADVLTRLERAHPDAPNTPRWLKDTMGYLSTHPDTAERIARVQRLAGADGL